MGQGNRVQDLLGTLPGAASPYCPVQEKTTRERCTQVGSIDQDYAQSLFSDAEPLEESFSDLDSEELWEEELEAEEPLRA